MDDDFVFDGFLPPLQNWSKIPHEFIAALPKITSLSELKCVLYILRHTWGFNEFDDAKHITMDEFMFGRKFTDGTRIDNGTGMTEPSIREGLRRAIEHGFILVSVDDTDRARVVKSFKLNMLNVGERSLPPDPKEFTPRGKEVLPRSEIDTSEINFGKKSPKPPKGGSVAKPLKPRKSWDRSKLEAYHEQHSAEVAFLLEAWGNIAPSHNLTTIRLYEYAAAHYGLNEIGFLPENYGSLYVTTRARLGWRGDFNPLMMLQVVEEWRNARLAPPPENKTETKPLSDYEVGRMMNTPGAMIWDGQS